MGGDDLGSDDEYLNPSIIADTAETGLLEKLDKADEKDSSKKRKRRANDVVVEDDDDDDSVDEMPTKKASARVLIEAGRNLANESAEVQSAFLWTAFSHEIQLNGHSVDKLPKLRPSNFCTSSLDTLEARLKEAVSMKKLKKWKTLKSPMVLVVCVSARRAVAVLKEMASLKVRAAKLFAKHMDVSQQRAMLKENSYGLAVGTPHRLLALCEPENGAEPALNLGSTKLIVLDSDTNPKGYTVCTLPDTASDTMELLRLRVLPQLKERKDLQIAMF